MDIDGSLPCSDKLKFGTKKEAEAQVVVLRHQKGIQLKVYMCKHCEWWHLATA